MNREQNIDLSLQNIQKEKTFIVMSVFNVGGIPLEPFRQESEENNELERFTKFLNEKCSDIILDEVIKRINNNNE
jgi:hypothetical protein